MRSTMHDVARMAGVSIKTVSNVINDYPHVRPDTRERVNQAIEQLDYRPNLSARGLRSGRTASRALGYQQVLAALDDAYDMAVAAEETARATRRFVRRQRSWFRRDRRIEWLDASDPELFGHVLRLAGAPPTGR